MTISPCASGSWIFTLQLWNRSSLMGAQLMDFFLETESKYSKAVFWNLAFSEWIRERKHASKPISSYHMLTSPSLFKVRDLQEVKVFKWSLLHLGNKWEWRERIAWTVHCFLEERKVSSLRSDFSTALLNDILKTVKKMRNKEVLFIELPTSQISWKTDPEICKDFP